MTSLLSDPAAPVLPDLPGFHAYHGIPIRDYSTDDNTLVGALVAYGHGHEPETLWAAYDAYAADQLGWNTPDGRLADQLAQATGDGRLAERWAVVGGGWICWDGVDSITPGSVPVTVLQPGPDLPDPTDEPNPDPEETP